MTHVGLAAMPDAAWREAVLPLFEGGEVDALEWSFDTGEPPAWLDQLLDHYATQGRLYGHGVSYSLLSARFEPRQARWLEAARDETRRRWYVGFSEHFGFMSAPGFRRGPPLPVPWNATTVAVGRDRLQRLKAATGCDVGLENLAFAFGRRDLLDQGPFLGDLLDAVDGYLVLDLHNLWCQVQNFGLQAGALLARYPLDRVRVVHVSGGSWSMAGGRPWRRDTHDGAVPEEVLALLPTALGLCRRVEVVVLERLGPTATPELAEEFRRVKRIVREGRLGR